MDILNTRLVTQPKTLSDKKSHFLKTLRQEEGEKCDKKDGGEELVNGVGSLDINDHSSTLSSSLEAEQRCVIVKDAYKETAIYEELLVIRN